MSDLTGISPSRISRVETATLWAREDEIEKLVKAAGGDEAVAAALASDLARSKAHEGSDLRTRLAGGHLENAKTVTSLIVSSQTVVWFEANVIPGMLQTYGYAYPIIAKSLERAESNVDDAQLSAAERSRQALLVADTSRQFTFIIGQEALTRRFACSAAAMRAQLQSLSTVMGLPNVWFGVIPFEGEFEETLPTSFALYGDQVVYEDESGDVMASNVADYRDRVKYLQEVAVTGEEAAVLIELAVDRLR